MEKHRYLREGLEHRLRTAVTAGEPVRVSSKLAAATPGIEE